MPSSPPRPTLISVQCLRGVAALMVVIFHAQGAVDLKLAGESVLGGFFALGQVGSIGVDVFFVISGFIMVYVSEPRFGRPGAAFEFLRRRVIRIVPLYWLVTALMVGLLLCVPQAFDTLRFRLEQTVASFLFLPTTSSAGEAVPVVGVGWTLTYEMIFYLFFAALLSTSLRTSLVVSALLFTAAAAGGHVWQPASAAGTYVLSDRYLEFFVGECAAVWFLRRGALGPRAARALVALVLCVLVAHVFFGRLRDAALFTCGLPAAILVLALVSLEQRGLLRSPEWLRRAGDASYSTYLSHGITTAALFKICVAAHVSRVVPADLLVVFAILHASVWGGILHRAVERPITRALSRAFG